MEILKTFRHEYKYIISYDEMLSLRKKLEEVMTPDRSSDGYIIRSLYFDTINDDDYYEKLNGDMNRKKIRLRIYDPDADFVKLEVKNKYDIHQLKESLVIDRHTAKELINGNYEVLLVYQNELATEIYTMLKTGIYLPKVVIEYQRYAYMTNTTTRVTFDYNVKTTDDYQSFFNKELNYIDVTDKKDVILEVKFDRFLEPYISNILASYTTRNQSVSKYIMGRNI